MRTNEFRHILIVSPAFPQTSEQGIVIPPLQLYLSALSSRYPQLKISVIALHFPFTTTPYSLNKCMVYPMNGKNGFLLWRPLVWFRTRSTIQKIQQETPIDGIHSFWYNEPAFLGDRMAKKLKVPHVSTLMGQDAKRDNAYLKFIRSKTIIRVALSTFQKSVFESHSNARIAEVIPFGISQLDNDLWSLSPQERTVDLLCVSSLIPLKQVHLFIRLVADIKAKLPHVKAVVIGDGPLRTVMEDEINHLGLAENITLLGEIPRKVCLAWMKQSKIVVHTSAYESQGYVLIEALALGCKVGVLTEGVNIACPSLYLAKDAQKLVNQVAEWLTDEKLQFESQVPLKMEDTVEKYMGLFRKHKWSAK
jgi:1,2-diacylglycerol 3-alpha-glucosyltransferase